MSGKARGGSKGSGPAAGNDTGTRSGRRAGAPPAKPATLERRSPRRVAWEWTKSILLTLALFLFIRTFLVQTFRIISGSMEPTLLVGDFLLVSRAAYGAAIPGTGLRVPGYERPSRGEIVVFRGPHEPETELVKRLVGLPGDTLAMRDGVLYINGEPQRESYAVHRFPGDLAHPWMEWQRAYLLPGTDADSYQPTLENWGPIVIPPDHFFMLGDNRDDSLDSRYWGLVPRELIGGRALVLYFSYDPGARTPVPWISAIRWSRIGDVIR